MYSTAISVLSSLATHGRKLTHAHTPHRHPHRTQCICGEGGIQNDNATWMHATFVGDMKLVRDAGFDGLKIDNCIFDLGLALGKFLMNYSA